MYSAWKNYKCMYVYVCIYIYIHIHSQRKIPILALSITLYRRHLLYAWWSWFSHLQIRIVVMYPWSPLAIQGWWWNLEMLPEELSTDCVHGSVRRWRRRRWKKQHQQRRECDRWKNNRRWVKGIGPWLISGYLQSNTIHGNSKMLHGSPWCEISFLAQGWSLFQHMGVAEVQ